VILVQPRAAVSLKVNGSLGEAAMQESVYGPILDILADHQPRSLGDIEQAVAGKATWSQLTQAVMVLAGAGHLMPAQESRVVEKAKPCTDRLNAALMDKARGSGDLNYLASPVTGGGITVTRFAQLFLLAQQQDKRQPEAWVQYVWQLLAAQNHGIVKDGKVLTTPEDNLAELSAQADAFVTQQWPILQALQVA